MKTSSLLTLVVAATMTFITIGAGIAVAQCGENCSHCAALAAKKKAGDASCSAAVTLAGGNCAEFGACSVDANLAGASGELLGKYEAEKSSSGQPYLAWKAPDFTLPTTDGKEISLSDYQGKAVVVAILAMHCNHCVDTMPMLARFREKYGSDLVILPVVTNARSFDAVKSWAEAVGADYPLLVSKDKSVSDQFKVQLVPTFVLINEKGFVTKKLITFQTESAIDVAIANLAGRDVSATGGGR